MEIKGEKAASPAMWEWTPLKSVGGICFDEIAEPIILRYGMEKVEPTHGVDEWVTYGTSDGDLEIYVENSRIDGVGCFRYFYYKGQNLIGMSVEDVKGMLGEPDDVGDEEPSGTPLFYENYAATLFEINGKIASCMASASWEDEDDNGSKTRLRV